MTKFVNLICADDKIYSIEYNEDSPFYGDYLNNIIELCDGDTKNISTKIPFALCEIELYSESKLFICTEIGAFFGCETDYISRIVDQLPDLIKNPQHQLVGALNKFLSFCSKDEYCRKVQNYAESFNNIKLIDIINSYERTGSYIYTMSHKTFDDNEVNLKIFDFVSYRYESRLTLYSIENEYIKHDMVFEGSVRLCSEKGVDRLDEYILQLTEIGINIYRIHDKVYLFLWNRCPEITAIWYNSKTYDYEYNRIYRDTSAKRQILEHFKNDYYNYNNLGEDNEMQMLQILSNSSCFDVTNYIQTSIGDTIQYRIIFPYIGCMFKNLYESDF